MRLKRARVKNFRCLEDVTVCFDDVTTFIGPNGVGKSSVLRALDWFFNGDQALVLDEEDIFKAATECKISVEVEFDSLTAADRSALGKYAPESLDTVVIWRHWENGEDKITGKALAFPPFEEVRSKSTAADKKAEYQSIRGQHQDLAAWTNITAAEEAMLVWERDHPELLEEAVVPGTNFFGFAGQGKMSGLFDFALVTADLRAKEEAEDSKSTIIGRILERTIQRENADEELRNLTQRLQSEQTGINQRNFGDQLDQLSEELSKAVGMFTAARSVKVSAKQMTIKPSKTQFAVAVLDENLEDDNNETRIERQGHGFQRALLVAAIKLLAERGAASQGQGVICLAIEEPELFQHPVQAQAFASTLRKVAEDRAQNIQITYATHSPYFIEATHFDQIRRVSRNRRDVQIAQVTVQKIVESLQGFVSEEKVRKQIDGTCLNSLPEALFADAAILVEGTTERAIFEGCGERDSHSLAVRGIVVADIGGKTSMFLPHAVLTAMGIKCYVVFDGDKDCASRMRTDGKNATDIANTESQLKQENRALLRYLGAPEIDWPSTQANDDYAVFEDTLETQLATDWPEWQTKCSELLSAGLGFSNKNASTYKFAAYKAAGSPPGVISGVVQQTQNLVGIS